MLGFNNFNWNVFKKQENHLKNIENLKYETVDSKNVFN